MTFKCTKVLFMLLKTIVVELLSLVLLMNLEKTEEIQKHYEQFIRHVYLVFPF